MTKTPFGNLADDTCPFDRVLGSDAARAVGRFDENGPHGYCAKSGGPLRATRDEAVEDERRNLAVTA